MGGQLYAFVHIDNCEARTRSVDADTSVAWNQKMAFPSCGTKSVINVQIKTESSPSISVASKVAFAPRCPPAHYAHARRRVEELPVAAARWRVRLRRGNWPPVNRLPRGNWPPCCRLQLLAGWLTRRARLTVQAIPVDTLPWDAQGQVPGVWVDLEDAYSSGGRGQGGLAGWYANNGNAVAPGGPGGPQSDAPSVLLQAWILFKPNAELAQRPKAAAAGNGTVSC